MHGKGPAVGGQGFTFSTDSTVTSSDVVIANNVIRDIKCWNKEIPAAVVNGKVQNDARGAVFQWIDTTTGKGLAIDELTGEYKGNVVSDMQIMVAKAIHDGVLQNSANLQIFTNTIEPDVVTWAASAGAVFEPQFRCNGDSMHHTIKGIVVIRVEDTRGFDIRHNEIVNVENLSIVPFSDCPEGFQGGASPENPDEIQSGNVRVISVAASVAFSSKNNGESTIMHNTVSNIDSMHGNVVIGIDLQGETSGVVVAHNDVNLKEGTAQTSKYIGLRIRKFVVQESIKVLSNNVFIQGTFTETAARRALLRNNNGLPETHPVVLEWPVGGCPFAQKN